MPVKIKPIHNFGPCTLDLEGIEGICALIDTEFGYGSYTAEDDIWIIYDEPSTSFLQIINGRDKLDSFIVVAPPPLMESDFKIEAYSIENLIIESNNLTDPPINIGKDASLNTDFRRTVKLIFNGDKAQAIFEVGPDGEDWIDHFLLDLNKYINPPTFLQKLGRLSILPLPFGTQVLIEESKCRITLKPSQPSQRLSGIGDNIIASIIYDCLKYLIAMAIGALVLWTLS